MSNQINLGGGVNSPQQNPSPDNTQNAREHTWDIESFEFDVCSVCGTVKNVNGNKPCTGTMPKVELRSDTQNDTSDIEASPEAQHIIHSAYQDVQGVMAGKKGYRLRQNELALAIDDYCAQREQAAELRGEINGLEWFLEEYGGEGASRYLVEDRLATLQATKPEKGGLHYGKTMQEV